MNGLTKLGTVLIVVFSVSVVALVAELLYVLWWRRYFRRRSGTEFPGDPSYGMTPSKEQLLYFFCWKNHNQSRVEPAGNNPIPAIRGPETVLVVDDDYLAKWQQGMYGPSRVLCTIKEEEREETETTSETENDHHQVKIKQVNFEAESESESEILSEIAVTVEAAENEATPFSTPCASPPYFTPSPSPNHDKYSPGNEEVYCNIES